MEPGQVISGRFQIERLAGKGGMGDVFLAHDLLTQSPVAVKIVRDPEEKTRQRFLREVQAISALSHPGIVGYIAHGQTSNGAPYLAMEWLEGEPLSTLLERRGPSLAEASQLYQRLTEALSFAHQSGIIHRDIKPSNIFLRGGRFDAPVLLDFGIARLSGIAAPMTNTGALLGSPGYIAPEQARGEKALDHRADLFSLGCVFFECLAGRPPFWGDHVIAVLTKILLEDAPRLSSFYPEAPEALDELIAKLLSKDPNERPKDANEVVEILSSIQVVSDASRIPRRALTENERRLFCVVLWESPEVRTIRQEANTVSDELWEILSPHSLRAVQEDSLFTTVHSFGGHLELLADGSRVVTFWSTSAATDLAARAARCALALQKLLPQTPLALGMGRAEQSPRPIGEAIDRAASLLRSAPLDTAVVLDHVLAGLLDTRFEVRQTKLGFLLLSEREDDTTGRSLLGKETPYVGREAELRLLEDLFDASCQEPEARAALITAPVGAGKSRLRRELLRRIATKPRKPEILMGYGEPLKIGSPFGLLLPALRRAAGILEGEPLATRRRKLRARLAHYVAPKELPRVSQFIGEMIGVPFPEEESPALRAARQNRRLLRDQMLRAFEDWLFAECSAHPVIFVLEDLQWGDSPTVQFIDSALERLRDLPLFVLALARPEVHEVFPGLWAGRTLQEICLGRLTKKASAQLARAILGESLDSTTLERLIEQSGGNAFYLEELIRATAEGRKDHLPETVLAMAQARLEELPQEARKVLRAASIFGDLFWEGGIKELLGDETKEPSAWLAELCRKEMIQRRSEPRFPGEYSFRHSLLREAAYAALTEDDRKLGHALAGEWLKDAGESDARILANHFERGGEKTRALALYQRAAAQALDAGDLEAVFFCVTRGRAAGATGEALGELCLFAAEAHLWRGENAQTERLGAEAMQHLPKGSALWYRAAQDLLRALGRLGYTEQLLTLAKEMAQLPSRPETRMDEILVWSSAVLSLHVLGCYHLADESFARFEALVARANVDDPIIAFDVPFTRALWASLSGDVGGALDFYQAAIIACQRVGDLRRESVATVSAAFVYIELGGYAHTEREMRRVLELSEKMGLRSVNAHAKNLLALSLAQQKKFEEAIALGSQSVASFIEQQDRRNEGGTRYDLARILLQAGHLDEALKEALVAVDALSVAPPLRATALASLAEIHLARKEVFSALSAATQAMQLLVSLGNTEDNESLIRLMYAEALLAAGKTEEAKKAATSAKERLLSRAQKIKDETWRQSFLTSVPENIRTMSL